MEKPRKFLATGVWLLVVSVALGAAWTVKKITNTAGGSNYPAIAVDGANVCVAWQDDTPGNCEIYFKKSTDGGATWQASKRLTYNTEDSRRPAIAVNGANVYVVWSDHAPGNNEIFFRWSADGGATWESAKRLTNNAGNSYHADIAASGAQLFVAWNDDTPGIDDIFFRQSADSGATWQAAKQLTFNAGYSTRPDVAVRNTNVFLVWNDDTPGNSEAYFRRSVDGGANWLTSKRLTTTSGYSEGPSVAVSGANVHVVWDDDTPGNGEIYFRTSADNGATWQKAKRLTSNAGQSYLPVVAVSGAKIQVAWQDYSPGAYNIFFRNSTDGGVTWQARQNLSNSTNQCEFPAVAVSDTAVYVVWEESPVGNREIFCAYSPL